jgi:opacity protein-like surface antigen
MNSKQMFVIAGILRPGFHLPTVRMTNLNFLLLLFFLFGGASLAVAQTDDEHPRVEVFAGFSVLGTNYKAEPSLPGEPVLTAFEAKQTLKGFNGAVTGYLSKNFGLTADFSAHFGTDKLADPLGGDIRTDTSVYNILGGPQYKFRNKSRVTPFVRGLAGVAITRAKITVPSLNASDTANSTDFALALGGGLDVRVNKRFDVRLFQVDYNPIFLKDGNDTGFNRRADNVRFSFGIVFK